MKTISLPPEFEGHELIASVSGGKDSTAFTLALRDAGIPCRYVFADTGWEAPQTYEYLDFLRDRLDIRIDVVGAEGGMLARGETRAGFPRRLGKWCTIELKIEPIRAYHGRVMDETGLDVVAIVGIRAEESPKRAALPEKDLEAEGPRGFGWKTWRPIIDWTVEDVLEIHRRHDLPVNELYRRGANRVGCWPCLFASKGEIKLIADIDPGRIDLIREHEARFSALRVERNAEKPGRYKHLDATFFTGRKGSAVGYIADIDSVVAWSRTSRGGRQLPLIQPPPEGGCYRWGLCDPLASSEEE